MRITRSLSCRCCRELQRGDDFRVQEIVLGGNCADVEELVGRESFGNAELEIVGRESGRPGSVGEFRRTVERENAMGTAELRSAEGICFGLAESAEFGSTAMNCFAAELRIERGGHCAWTRRIGKDVEIGERKRIDEAESGCMVSFSFARKTGDDVGAYGGMGKKFANECCAAGVMLRAIPAMHGGEDIVRAGLERHVKVLGDATGAGEKGDEVLRDVERLDGADAEARERSFVENAAQEIEKVGTGREVAPPGAEIDAAENNFLEAGIAEATDFGKDSVGRKAAAFAADKWDNAEGAAIVAAVLNFESGASVISFSAEDRGNEDVARGEDVSNQEAGRLRRGTMGPD